MYNRTCCSARINFCFFIIQENTLREDVCAAIFPAYLQPQCSLFPSQKNKYNSHIHPTVKQAGRRRRGRGQGQGGCRGGCLRERSRLQQRYHRPGGHCPGRRRRRRRRCPCERGKFKVRPSLSPSSSFSRTVLGSTVLMLLYYRTTHAVGHVSLITKKYPNLLFT